MLNRSSEETLARHKHEQLLGVKETTAVVKVVFHSFNNENMHPTFKCSRFGCAFPSMFQHQRSTAVPSTFYNILE